MKLFKYRIVKRSRPWGTGFVIQQKFILLPFWLDMPSWKVFTYCTNFFGNIEAARKELHWQESVWKDEVVE
jgi:hypothetical protein